MTADKNKIPYSPLEEKTSDIITFDAEFLKRKILQPNSTEAQKGDTIKDNEFERFYADTNDMQYTYNNTKLAKLMIESDFLPVFADNHGAKFDVASKRANNPVYVVVKATVPERMRLQDGFNYTPESESIVNSVGYLYDMALLGGAEKPILKVKEIVNAVKGNPISQHVNPDTIREYAEKLNDLRNIELEIDPSQHAKYNADNKRKRQFDGDPIKTNLIPAKIVPHEDDIYFIPYEYPPTYEYAKRTGQIVPIDYDMRDLTSIKSYDKNGIENIKKSKIKQNTVIRGNIRDHIILSVKAMEANRKLENSILFDKIYARIHQDNPNSKKQTMDNNIEDVLDVLKAKGLFKNYRVEHKARKKHKVIFILNDAPNYKKITKS